MFLRFPPAGDPAEASSHHASLSTCLVALAIGAASMASRGALPNWGTDGVPFAFAFPAVALVALWFGTLEGVLTAMASAVWALVPSVAPTVAGPDGVVHIELFLGAAAAVAVGCGHVGLSSVSQRPVEGNRRSVGQRLFLAACCAAGLILAVAAVVGGAGLLALRSGAQSTVQRTVDVAAGEMRRMAVEHRILAEKISTLPELRRGDTLSAATVDRLRSELRALSSGSPEIVGLTFLDSAGRSAVSFGLAAGVRVDAGTGRALLVHRYPFESRAGSVVQMTIDPDLLGGRLANRIEGPDDLALQLQGADGSPVITVRGGRVGSDAVPDAQPADPRIESAAALSAWQMRLSASLPERSLVDRWLARMWTLMMFVVPTAFVLAWSALQSPGWRPARPAS